MRTLHSPKPRPRHTRNEIVSLAPSVTETLFALGFGNRVVGVTTYCDYPAEAQKLPKIGGFINPSLEVIAAQRPDLVIGVNDSNHPVKAREMERLGLKVALVSVNSVNDILNSIKSIAYMIGSPEAGDKLVRQNQAAIRRSAKARGAGATPPDSFSRGPSPSGRSGGAKFSRMN